MGKLLDLTSRLKKRRASDALKKALGNTAPKSNQKAENFHSFNLNTFSPPITGTENKDGASPDFNSQNFMEKLESEIDANRPNAALLDMTEMREEILSRERREVKRTILSEFIGVCVVLPNRGLCKVSLYDISENGVGFDIDVRQGAFSLNEQVAMRVYLNKKTYFAFTVHISNVRHLELEGMVRHGASIVKGTVNDVALHHFIKFIENVSASLKKDEGDVMVSNIM